MCLLCAGSVGADPALQSARSSKQQPPAVSGSLHQPPIPRFHFGSSHGQQVIGIDKAEGVAGGASLPASTVFHMSHSRTCSEGDAWVTLLHKWIWDTVSGINASQKTA